MINPGGFKEFNITLTKTNSRIDQTRSINSPVMEANSAKI